MLDLIHIDVCSMDAGSNSGVKYFITFFDEYSQKVGAFVLKRKTWCSRHSKNLKPELRRNYLKAQVFKVTYH